MPNFRTYTFSYSPSWLANHFGERLMGTLALYFDLAAEADGQALKSGMLRSNTYPADALPYHGNERMMPRYAADTDAIYRERLAEAWETWQHGGNETGIMSQYAAMGLPSSLCLPERIFDLEFPPDHTDWSRFVVAILPPNPWSVVPPTTDEWSTLVSIAKKWKSGHEICVRIIVLGAGWFVGEPGIIIGTPGLVLGGSVVHSYAVPL